MASIIDPIPDYCRKDTLIVGCGNILLGDDGFGPEAVAYLQGHYAIPEDVAVLDAGTALTEVLLDIAVSPLKPRRLVLIDVLDAGRPAGTMSMLSLDKLRQRTQRAFSPHQAPASALLSELEGLAGVEVLLLTVQPAELSQDVRPGLSAPLRDAVPHVCEFIAKTFLAQTQGPGAGRPAAEHPEASRHYGQLIRAVVEG